MRRVVFLLCLFISVSYAQKFKLCDVSKAESPLLSVNQSYHLKTLYGPFVEAHGQSDKQFIPTNIHPFIYAAHKAYAEHRPLTISPDGIWLLISQGALSHLAAHSKEYKEFSASIQNNKMLILDDPAFTSNSKSEWPKLINFFTKKLQSNSSKLVASHYAPSFSTTDINVKNAFKVCQLSTRSEQFQFGLFSLCGIPEILLEGNTADWQKISSKLQQLNQIGMKDWVDHLKPIIEEFIAASQGKVDKSFWNSFYKFNNECGDASVSGWILNFFPYAANGNMRHFVQAKSSDILKYIPDSDPNMSFTSGRNYLPFVWKHEGQSSKMRIEAGFMGVSQDPQTLALKAEINWAVIKRPADGHISIWQQNVVREGSISKKKLSAAYSATYIDINSFENESDSGLKQLKLLEYAIVKGKVKGAFLKQLTSLPNFKALELQNWNIESDFFPYISKLKNKSFIFSQDLNSEFFKFLPETSNTLIFKNCLVKADYFANIRVSTIENIEFYNCTFEENTFRELQKLKDSLLSLSIHKSESISEHDLSKVNVLSKLKTLSIKSCKLSTLPLFKLPNLESLNLSSNRLSDLKSIQSLPSLKYLNLANNRIDGKVEFSSFKNLEHLIIHHNQVNSIKADLKHLLTLDASSNKLQTLPHTGKSRLTKLIVEKNQINKAHLPTALAETLEYLSLEQVKLNRDNAVSIGSMKNLKYLSLKNCSLSNEGIQELTKIPKLNTLRLWTNKDLNDLCKDNILALFHKGTDISIFDCGFSAKTMDDFAKLRERLKVN